MNYKDLIPEQIYTSEVNYTLDDFAKDFRGQAEKDWGVEKLDKGNKDRTLYQAIFMIVVFASQGKSTKLINEILLGKNTKELQEAVKEFTDMYDQEIKILESLQMKMFLDNLKKYGVSDSLNLTLLNADFLAWLKKVLDQK